jgi:hypothetical protein
MPRKSTKTTPVLNTEIPKPDHEEQSGELIEIPDNSCALWGALASQDYDHFQPFVELIDNAIAAINSSICHGRIHVNFNFDTNVGSVEHSGGKTFPLDKNELARCFTYGGKRPTRLNEHGCGLKSSLAILDPTNTKWAIYIKYVENGILRVKSISAPYSNKMTICDQSDWPGKDKTAEEGSFIQFPIGKERFENMYQKKKDARMEDLHDRIKYHFTHMWMKVDEMIEGKLKMYYNDTPLVPFTFGAEILNDYIKHTYNKEFTLSSGASVKIQQILLSEKASARAGLPGSYKFKRSQTSSGAYLFKNGRFIEHINTDDPSRGNLYSSIFGASSHPSHAGMIVLVNVIGNQECLPVTVPTKNRFIGGLLFQELIEHVGRNITRPEKSSEEKEAILADDYMKREESTIKRIYPSAVFEPEKSFLYPDGTTRTAPIDLVISYNRTRELIEFKRDIRPSKDDIGQLFTNWTVVSHLPENASWELRPTLVLRAAATDTCLISDSVRNMLEILEDTGFRPVIRNTNNDTLWPTNNS